MAIALASEGADMTRVYGTTYSDLFNPGVGIVDRFSPSDKVLGITGITGGAPSLPSEGTYLRIVNQYDPIAFMPKYTSNVIALINAVMGFVFEHGRLKNIDYSQSYDKH